jgi:hypothetical protein
MTRLDFTAAAGAAGSVADDSAGAGASTTGAGADGASCTGAAVGAGVTSVAVDSSELAASSPDFFAAALPVAAAFLGALTGFTSSG